MKKLPNSYRCFIILAFIVIIANAYKPIYLPIFTNSMDVRLAFLNSIADDAFYYLNIAKHITDNGVPSFDGMTITNGYHPLWLAVLVILGHINLDSIFSFFAIIVAIPILCVILGSYFLSRSLVFIDEKYKKYTVFIVVYYGYWALSMSTVGMETCLIFLFFPLLLFHVAFFCKENKPLSILYIALCGSALILSRLDTVILVGLIYVCCLITSNSKKLSSAVIIRSLAYLFLGSLPLLLYLAYNYTQFGAFMPVSGQAKGLHTTSFFISETAINRYIDYGILHHWKDILQCLIIICAMPFVLRRLVIEKRAFDFVLFSVVLFPFLYFPYTAMRSDWPLWPWYFYPFVLSSSICFAILVFVSCEYVESHFSAPHMVHTIPRIHTCAYMTFLSLYCVLAIWKGIHWKENPPVKNSLLCAAVKIKAFAAQHPGVYAMGDRAGIVGYLLNNPVIQLEGLACDTTMVKNISSQKNLLTVLDEYKVNYYIATINPDTPINNPWKNENGWHFTEPQQGGTHTPKMKAVYKGEPVYSFECESEEYKGLKYVTHIFAIRPK